MLKRRTKGVLAMLMSVLLMAGIVLPLTACSKKKDSIVIMTEELSGLFNPFYATSGTDMDVVGMTQISMLSTDKEGNPVAGDEESTVVKAFDYVINGSGATTTMEMLICYRAAAKCLAEKGITLMDGIADELLTVQEMAGFQMILAKDAAEMVFEITCA